MSTHVKKPELRRGNKWFAVYDSNHDFIGRVQAANRLEAYVKAELLYGDKIIVQEILA